MFRKIITSAAFCVLLTLLIVHANEVIIEKENNRYYMLREQLEELNEQYEVQVYGSCHAYTSFKPMYLTETYGLTSYNLSNPSEIMPITYLRMLERFKKDVPKIALVETWGVNLYETYIKFNDMQDYVQANMDPIPLSAEKLQMMRDVPLARMLEENFAIAKYKERLIHGEMIASDTRYNFEDIYWECCQEETSFQFIEMKYRFMNNGYKPNPSIPLVGYEEWQKKPSKESTFPLEWDMEKYIDKIIDLCDEYGVKLIFYRAPYRSTELELKKVNYLEGYLAQRGIPYYDMESELVFDPNVDFYDHEHLSETGAQKVTEFLSREIVRHLNEDGIVSE